MIDSCNFLPSNISPSLHTTPISSVHTISQNKTNLTETIKTESIPSPNTVCSNLTPLAPPFVPKIPDNPPLHDTEHEINLHHSRRILISLPTTERKLFSFIDSGSDLCLVKKSVATLLHSDGNGKIKLTDKSAQNVSGTSVDLLGLIPITFTLPNNRKLIHNFYVVEDSNFPGALLIGNDLLNRVKAIIKFEGNKNSCVTIYDNIFMGKSYTQNDFESVRSISPSDITRTLTIHAKSDTMIPPNSIHPCIASISGTLPFATDISVYDCTDIPGFKIAKSVSSWNHKNTLLIATINTTDDPIMLKKGDTLGSALPIELIQNDKCPDITFDPLTEQLNALDLSHLEPTQQTQLLDILHHNSSAFSTPEAPIGHIKNVQHDIDTLPGHISYTPPYRTPQSQQKIVTETITELLRLDIIEPSISEWNSPICLVKKPNGSVRLCLDLRGVNKLTSLKPFPIPRISETLDSLAGMKYFTTVDAKSGFHHIEINPNHRHKTAFRTKDGVYQYKRMPFGGRNSTFSFQMAMTRLLSDTLGIHALVYVDDVIIYSNSFEDHMVHLDNILTKLTVGGVKLDLNKSTFAKPSVKFLGFIVDGNGISPNPAKVQSITNFPIPTNTKQIKQLLGSVGFFRSFIPDFAKITAPLTSLLKKTSPWKWTETENVSFLKLLEALKTAPILKHPDFTLPFSIHTDASGQSIAGVLCQTFDGQLHPISYYSRSLRGAEPRYSIAELEALAVVASIKNFTILCMVDPLV